MSTKIMTPRTSRAAITIMAKTQAGKGRTIPLDLTQSARRRVRGREGEREEGGGETDKTRMERNGRDGEEKEGGRRKIYKFKE